MHRKRVNEVAEGADRRFPTPPAIRTYRYEGWRLRRQPWVNTDAAATAPAICTNAERLARVMEVGRTPSPPFETGPTKHIGPKQGEVASALLTRQAHGPKISPGSASVALRIEPRRRVKCPPIDLLESRLDVVEQPVLRVT